MTPSALFAVLPYAALAAFGAAIAIRYLLAWKRMDAGSEPAPPGTREAFRGGPLWRAGVALLFLGHLLGVVLPRGVLAWNVSPARLYLLEGLAFASGVAALLGWTRLVWRHLGRTGSLAAELAETAFLSLLGLALASGLMTAVFHRWGSSWGVMTLTPYAWSLLRGRPLTDLASQLPYLVHLHVAAALAALVIAPWTRLGAFLVAALHRVFQAMGRPVATLGAAVEAWFRRRNPAAWIWPDED